MNNSLQGTVAIITGASRGIGKATALTLAASGVNLALVARSSQALEDVATQCKQLGADALAITADLTNVDHLPNILTAVKNKWGALHYLINNAGIYKHAAADKSSVTQWDKELDINFRALAHLTRYALPEIEKQPRGAIVNIASISGKMSHAGASMYCATKHAVIGFANAVFEDVRERNIKVCSICPGYVNTEMVASDSIDPAKCIQPEDIAKAVMFVLTFPDTGCPTEIVVRPQLSPYK
jgi:NADP-dependent 3-hydroxy acid dehydrogenase YdfG